MCKPPSSPPPSKGAPRYPEQISEGNLFGSGATTLRVQGPTGIPGQSPGNCCCCTYTCSGAVNIR
ncbi:hypothetical protein H4683_000362 [Filibacter limicola]|uniref:Uncharacterized protein n=1 Tax=Sporosarcina limicola TaxID=34101 RepID=A0A927R324_9BACL|nr:hypothetical protein [Sporosarcina limicola]